MAIEELAGATSDELARGRHDEPPEEAWIVGVAIHRVQLAGAVCHIANRIG